MRWTDVETIADKSFRKNTVAHMKCFLRNKPILKLLKKKILNFLRHNPILDLLRNDPILNFPKKQTTNQLSHQ